MEIEHFYIKKHKPSALIFALIATLILFALTGCGEVQRGNKDDDIDSTLKIAFSKEGSDLYTVDSFMFLCSNGTKRVKLTPEEFDKLQSLVFYVGQGSTVKNINEKSLSANQKYVYDGLPEVFDTLARGDELYSEEASDPDWQLHKNYDLDKDNQVSYREYAMVIIDNINRKIGNN